MPLTKTQLRGIPILFIPGNAGSYKQVRPLAAETANLYHDTLQHDGASVGAGVRSLDVFTVDFNEDITAFHGQTLLDQAEYLNEAVRYILSLYSDPQRADRDSNLPDPTSVVILGHSMGGVVARAMLVQPNYQANSINTIITMSAPHARPPVTFDGEIVQIYDNINEYWRAAHAQRWANNNPLWHVTLISIAGGNLDTVVPSDYASVEPLIPDTHGFTVFTTGIPSVWTSMDHQAILWCDQFRKVVAKTLFDIVDVNRASQTKPRADRMRVFRKRFLPGMEVTTEKTILLQEASHLLTLDDEASRIVPAGERFVLTDLGTDHHTIVHLLPIPPQDQSMPKRFNLLTDFPLSSIKDNGPLEVLICSVLPSQSGSAISRFLSHTDVSVGGAGPSKLACKNVDSDVVLIPASTEATNAPFYLEGEKEIKPFSFLEYDLEHLLESDFIAVVDKANSRSEGFLVAEFRDRDVGIEDDAVSLTNAILGVGIALPRNRPISTHVQLPWIKSALLAFGLRLHMSGCEGRRQLFAPVIRQYLNEPYESKYFVNVRTASISLHGVAPFVPPPLESVERAEGLGLQVWSDGTCSTLTVDIRLDILASLGKLYMRYRTVFAAFPLLIVTLVMRKQFRVYDQTGIFIPFSDGLDLSLRRSVPLLLLSLTLLSASLAGTSAASPALFWSKRHADLFHRNELLIGTADPLYCGLVPLIGIICIGVCALLHYVVLALTQSLGLIYGLTSSRPPSEQNGEHHQGDSSQVLVPSTPRRRMISTAILLFLVSTFIPYQFAYLVACLVQLFTTVRAGRISQTTISASNSNYYHYAHTVLLLMMWVLPINLPILAVWIRNLAVHWLTPFSSHHNVLSIMPFILLVENLTTGKMVPQVTSRLRHVTSVLFFGTALCAAVYGVSHAYMLHYLVNVIAAWLVVLHSTSETWSIAVIGSMFEGSAGDGRKWEKPHWIRTEKSI